MRVALLGFMGCGKTSVGKILADRLGMSFVDIDHQITLTEQMPISQIFAQKGEQYFRKIESQIIGEYSRKNNIIISLGGGAVLSSTNLQYLLDFDRVYLQDDIADIYARLKNDTTRPLLKTGSFESFQALFESRKAIYQDFATITIQAKGMTPDQIATQILSQIIE